MVIIIASLLAKGVSVFHRVPAIADIEEIIQLLQLVGVTVLYEKENHLVTVDTRTISSVQLSCEKMKTTRASILLLAPLLVRCGIATVGLPGGDQIGVRPLNLHLSGLEKMGATCVIKECTLSAQSSRLQGSTIVLAYPSVGATENILMAATCATGRTTIINAAVEPEVSDLITVLKKMGARIRIKPPATIVIDGVEQLHPVEYTIMPDRLEAGALLCAGAITQGDIFISNILPDCLAVPLLKLEEMGNVLTYTYGKKGIRIKVFEKSKGITIKTGPYPQFPTDLQAPFMSALCVASGTTVIEETVFENRMSHAAELNKLGAHIVTNQNSKAIINGATQLIGTSVVGNDIRAVCALVLAGLYAEGITHVYGVTHWLRGFEKLEKKLQMLGAEVAISELHMSNQVTHSSSATKSAY